MPKRKRKKIGWMTVVLNATGKDAPFAVEARSTTNKTNCALWDREAWGRAALAGRPQNPMHPVHPAWGHRTQGYLRYTIYYT